MGAVYPTPPTRSKVMSDNVVHMTQLLEDRKWDEIVLTVGTYADQHSCTMTLELLYQRFKERYNSELVTLPIKESK
jgi:hypothetical protein